MVKKKVIERLMVTRKKYKKPFQRNSYKKKSIFIKNDSDSLDIDGSDEISDIRLFMDLDNHNDKS